MKYPKMKKIGDIFELLHCGNPKRIVFDLSEDGTFYNAKIYIDIVDKSKDKEYETFPLKDLNQTKEHLRLFL